MVRQPHGDECGAYYFEGEDGPRYFRDDAVERWERDMLAEDSLFWPSDDPGRDALVAAFELSHGVPFAIARSAMFGYRAWQDRTLAQARNQVAAAIVELDAKRRAKFMESLRVLISAGVPA